MIHSVSTVGSRTTSPRMKKRLKSAVNVRSDGVVVIDRDDPPPAAAPRAAYRGAFYSLGRRGEAIKHVYHYIGRCGRNLTTTVKYSPSRRARTRTVSPILFAAMSI